MYSVIKYQCCRYIIAVKEKHNNQWKLSKSLAALYLISGRERATKCLSVHVK